MIKLPNALGVFNHVISHGVKQNNHYHLDDLEAWYDFDGYSCYLKYRELKLSVYFHSRYECDYQQKSTLESFIRIIDKGTNALSKPKT
ncbi:DUF3081 family protein [Paraglaciecola sp.]|uniref:DUF3081 family protein n=1 Tax=Paraglaciecola sp. TaxID=1920173 RepID=UPI003EF31591